MSKNIKIIIASVVLIALIIAVVVCVNNSKQNTEIDNTNSIANSTSETEKKSEKTITINVYNKDNESIYGGNIKTDKQYLIEVLEDNKDLDVKAEDSQYGKYITSINGIEQGDNYYWSYYIDGQYAEVGVSSCEIEDGKTYEFKIEKMEF